MITTEPTTWNNFEDHPSFSEFAFGSGWREWYGELESPEDDLRMLKKCALDLKQAFPEVTVRLTVLDDLTTYVEVANQSLSGIFGNGCESETFFIQFDADADDPLAPDVNQDNLTSQQVIDVFRKLVM